MVADQISVPTNSRGTLPRGAAEGWRKDLPTSQSKCVRSSKSLDQFWARRRYCSGLFDWRRDARRRRAGLRRGLRPAAFDSDRRNGGQAESTWSWNYSGSQGASRFFGSGSFSVWHVARVHSWTISSGQEYRQLTLFATMVSEAWQISGTKVETWRCSGFWLT